MSKTKIEPLVYGAVTIALATALSFVKILQMPYGGSVTLISMLPIILYSIKFGVKKGLCVSFLYGVIQVSAGTESPFAWGLNAGTLVVCVLFDYVVAFGALGVAGIFRDKGYSGRLIGTALAVFLRFASHYVSGVTIWKNFEEFEIFGSTFINPYLYSLAYNGAYMLPELVFTLIAAGIMLKIPAMNRMLAGT